MTEITHINHTKEVVQEIRIEQIEELACKFNVLNDCINLLTDCFTNQYFSKNNLQLTSLLLVIKDYSANLSKSLNDFHQSCENENSIVY